MGEVIKQTGQGLMGSLPVIGGLVNGISNFFTSKYNTDATNKANKELAEYQYSKNLENWKMQNEYNSPTAQMQRFKDAGLNPHLIYGGGSGSAGNATSIPQYQAPRMEYNLKSPIDPHSTIQAFQQFQLTKAQIDNVRADTEVKSATAQYKLQGLKDMLDILTEKRIITGQQRDRMATELGWFNAPMGWQPQTKGQALLDYQLQGREQGLLRGMSDINLKVQQARKTGYEADLYDWGFWTKMAQGFGIKLPPLNFKRRK